MAPPVKNGDFQRELAEKSGSRTHQGRLTPLTGFEDRAPHRGTILFQRGEA